jgi:hypothetical protein
MPTIGSTNESTAAMMITTSMGRRTLRSLLEIDHRDRRGHSNVEGASRDGADPPRQTGRTA